LLIPSVGKDWEPSWTKFFTRLLRNTLKIDEEINGRWLELAIAAEQVLEIITPRLLDVLQSERPDYEPIVPSLIHGDLHAENTGTKKESGEIIFYDAGSYFAHNEMELGMWRRGVDAAKYLGPRYLREYQRLFDPAEPKAEFVKFQSLLFAVYSLSVEQKFIIGVALKT
jgi:protein-ribulosamine 3-kinase